MLKSNNMKKGFSLAELMVCLALISVIAALVMPAIERLKPNKKKMMFKKAYYLTERIVSELINDEDLYPALDGKIGFDNTCEVDVNGVKYGTDNSSDSATEAYTKFCQLFGAKLNTTTNVTVDSCKEEEDAWSTGARSFKTTDAIEWLMPKTKFESQNTYYAIHVDVNGPDEPNCEDGAEGCVDPDRFMIKVRADGKIKVDGLKAKEYVRTGNVIERK